MTVRSSRRGPFRIVFFRDWRRWRVGPWPASSHGYYRWMLDLGPVRVCRRKSRRERDAVLRAALFTDSQREWRNG